MYAVSGCLPHCEGALSPKWCATIVPSNTYASVMFWFVSSKASMAAADLQGQIQERYSMTAMYRLRRVNNGEGKGRETQCGVQESSRGAEPPIVGRTERLIEESCL